MCKLIWVVLCTALLVTSSVAAQSLHFSILPSARTKPLTCAEWKSAFLILDTTESIDLVLKEHNTLFGATTRPIKLPYLRGLQYGYLNALEDAFRLIKAEGGGDPDRELPPTWSSMLIPSGGIDTALVSSIDHYCDDLSNGDSNIAEALVLTLNDGKRVTRFSPSERFDLLTSYQCRAEDADHSVDSLSPWFTVGYKDGQKFLWYLLRKQGLAKIPRWEVLLNQLEIHQFELPLGTELYASLTSFCGESRNSQIPYALAAKVTAFQVRGESESADPILAGYYCKELPAVWANGHQFKGKTCLGVTVFVETSPVLEDPFGYMVGVINNSNGPIDFDWAQWKIISGDSKHAMRTDAALSPDTIVSKLRKNAKVSGAVAAFSSYLSANTPVSAVVNGPDGTSTVSVYPSAEEASATSSVAANAASAPRYAFASTMSDISLRRTTISPKQGIAGQFIYFPKPKEKSAELQVHIAGLPTFELEVSTKK